MTIATNVVKLTIENGQRSAEKTVRVDAGKRVAVAAVAKPDPTQIIDLEILENNSRIHPSVDLSFYREVDTGDVMTRKKPLNYKGGSQLTCRVQSKTQVSQDTEIEVVFETEKEEQYC